LNSLVSLTLVNNTISFGQLNVGDSANTTNNTPDPFVLRNDGNCFANVNLSADKLIWDSKPTPSSFFQYEINNYTGMPNAFNSSGSQTSWANVPDANQTVIASLNYTDLNDMSRIDVYVKVPLDEPAGNKTGILTFTGSYVRKD